MAEKFLILHTVSTTTSIKWPFLPSKPIIWPFFNVVQNDNFVTFHCNLVLPNLWVKFRNLNIVKTLKANFLVQVKRAQCGVYENFVSLFLIKNCVKSTFLQNSFTVNWFHDSQNIFLVIQNFSFVHTVFHGKKQMKFCSAWCWEANFTEKFVKLIVC